MTPTLNVNLKPCTCEVDTPYGKAKPSQCTGKCPGAPVLIPCLLPRTVEFTVRVGDCCGCAGEFRASPENHMPLCPAHPIRVICSIGGEAWKASEVRHTSPIMHDDRGPFDGAWTERGMRDAALSACRDRWALVEALVLGKVNMWDPPDLVPLPEELMMQRDTVFAALTKLVQAEKAAIAAQAECDAAFPIDAYVKVPAPDHRSEPRPSTVRLAAFVAHLIATVGDLP